MPTIDGPSVSDVYVLCLMSYVLCLVDDRSARRTYSTRRTIAQISLIISFDPSVNYQLYIICLSHRKEFLMVDHRSVVESLRRERDDALEALEKMKVERDDARTALGRVLRARCRDWDRYMESWNSRDVASPPR